MNQNKGATLFFTEQIKVNLIKMKYTKINEQKDINGIEFNNQKQLWLHILMIFLIQKSFELQNDEKIKDKTGFPMLKSLINRNCRYRTLKGQYLSLKRLYDQNTSTININISLINCVFKHFSIQEIKRQVQKRILRQNRVQKMNVSNKILLNFGEFNSLLDQEKKQNQNTLVVIKEKQNYILLVLQNFQDIKLIEQNTIYKKSLSSKNQSSAKQIMKFMLFFSLFAFFLSAKYIFNWSFGQNNFIREKLNIVLGIKRSLQQFFIGFLPK